MPGRKGNQAEREVSKLLESWWRKFLPDARFERTPLSGGLHHALDFRVVGDVMVDPKTAPTFPFVVEVKRREAGDVARLISGKPTPIWGWWREVQSDANDAQLEPMLWFRRNRTPWRVLVRADFVDARWRESAGSFDELLPQLPEATWEPEDLPFGAGARPIMYLASELLSSDPSSFAVSSG